MTKPQALTCLFDLHQHARLSAGHNNGRSKSAGGGHAQRGASHPTADAGFGRIIRPPMRDGCWAMGWQAIDTAPYGSELRLSIIEKGEVHALAFPCWRTGDGWLNCLTN